MVVFKNVKILLQLIFLFVLSADIALMSVVPIKNVQDEPTIFLYILGTIFWLAVVAIFISIILRDSKRKKDKAYNKSSKIEHFGLLNFFTSKEAIIIDIIFLANILLTIIVGEFHSNKDGLLLYVLAAQVFTLGLHSIVNGRNYDYIKYKKGELN